LYNPPTTTTYTVALVASFPDGCSDTTSKTLTVSESPICDFSIDDLGFLRTKFTPSNNSYSSYTWIFGEGGSSSDVSPTYNYAYPGNFNVTMRAINAAGCDCEITKRINANTSVESIVANNKISVYPNPNNGTFSVSNDNGTEMKVEVFNILGVKVYSSVSEDGTMNVDMSDEARGIYLVKVTINGVTSVTKITINR